MIGIYPSRGSSLVKLLQPAMFKPYNHDRTKCANFPVACQVTLVSLKVSAKQAFILMLCAIILIDPTLFLLSQMSAFISGIILPVDGGFNAYSGV
jgi:hypothetical protein